jgi:hypothetical protein
MRLKRKWKSDWEGRPLREGNRVRVCAVPNPKGMSEQGLKESHPAFRYAVGRNCTICHFDEWDSNGWSLQASISSAWQAVRSSKSGTTVTTCGCINSLATVTTYGCINSSAGALRSHRAPVKGSRSAWRGGPRLRRHQGQVEKTSGTVSPSSKAQYGA